MSRNHAQAPLTAADLTAAILKVRAAYHAKGHTNWDIGNGLCENFAHDVCEEWLGKGWIMLEERDGRDWSTLETANFVHDEVEWDWPIVDRILGAAAPQDRAAWDKVDPSCATHVWIRFNDKHYDCEHPDGVSSFFELNFFRRWADLTAHLESEQTDAPAYG